MNSNEISESSNYQLENRIEQAIPSYRDTEESNPGFKICNQNVDRLQHIPEVPGLSPGSQSEYLLVLGQKHDYSRGFKELF